jgi:hypothetical protein
MQEFEAFLRTVRRYIEMTQGDAMVHRSVAQSVNGLREFLEVERKRVPGSVLFEADRLECQFFGGYDPSFEGDEPPGLVSDGSANGDLTPDYIELSVEVKAWCRRINWRANGTKSCM